MALVGRRRAALEDTLAIVPRDARARGAVFPCDVSRADAVERMAADVMARFGRVDVLVNSAGINVPRRSLRELSLEDWHRVLDTNLNGAYYCIRAFLPAMRAQGDGTIVNINSDVGKSARDLAGPAYVTSKFGMTGLTQQINAEERGSGIRATSIFPRDVNTPSARSPPATAAGGGAGADAAAGGPRRVRVAGRDASTAGHRRRDSVRRRASSRGDRLGS